MDIEELRSLLDKYINVADLTDLQVLKIFEEESKNEYSIFMCNERNSPD